MKQQPPTILRSLITVCLPLIVGSINQSAHAQEKFIPLDAAAYAKRLSLDLRGMLPTQSEIDLVSSTSGAEELIDEYMESEEFLERMRVLFNDVLLVKTGRVAFREAYEENERVGLASAVGQECLRLFSHLLKNDLPLTELVTADYTITNVTLANWWNIDYPEGSEGWIVSKYNDGRPHSGVLSQQSFYHRYDNDSSNRQRRRANGVSKIFLGDNHFLRDVSFDFKVSAEDLGNLDNAIKNQDACLACHASLDGLGSFLNGVSVGPVGQDYKALERFRYYNQQGFNRWKLITGRSPSYYGNQGTSLQDLGVYIAADPRFPRAMTRHLFEGLTHLKTNNTDDSYLESFAQVLIDSGLRPKPLIKAILTSPEYQASGVTEQASATDEKYVLPFKTLMPEQASTMVKSLTGQVWGAQRGAQKEYPVLEHNSFFMVPAGGIDGLVVTLRNRTVNASMLLVMKRFAESIAAQSSFELQPNFPAEDKRVFTIVSISDRPDNGGENSIRRQIVEWYGRFFGESLGMTDPQVDEAYALFVDLYNLNSPQTQRAWVDLLSGFLRDPGFYFY